MRGVLGILIGAGLYAEVYPYIESNLLKVGDYGKLTIPALLGVEPWIVIAVIVVVGGAAVLWMDRVDPAKRASR
ncbi:MAG TPA: hypothetical protein VNN77_13590 [candidate division Zixibacteria bacterium]|nr:hypothetical protein [candidate division Zixibacteria bacterium]